MLESVASSSGRSIGADGNLSLSLSGTGELGNVEKQGSRISNPEVDSEGSLAKYSGEPTARASWLFFENSTFYWTANAALDLVVVSLDLGPRKLRRQFRRKPPPRVVLLVLFVKNGNYRRHVLASIPQSVPKS